MSEERRTVNLTAKVQVLSQGGYAWSLELKAEVSGFEDLATRINKVEAQLKKLGFEPAPRTQPAATVSNGLVAGPATEIVEVGKLVGKWEDGSDYWKVICPKYPVHGVRVWPEVLADAGIRDADFRYAYQLAGTATIVLKDNGKPKKIISFALAGPPVPVKPAPPDRQPEDAF